MKPSVLMSAVVIFTTPDGVPTLIASEPEPLVDSVPPVVSIVTDPFPATPTGDAEIETFVALPTPCIAPIVFVTTAGGSWLAVTGR